MILIKQTLVSCFTFVFSITKFINKNMGKLIKDTETKSVLFSKIRLTE